MRYFTFSLDVELAWDCTPIQSSPTNDKWQVLSNDAAAGREAVTSLLEIFDEYSIPATWAIVGHLFLEECSQEDHLRTDRIDRIDPYGDVNRDPLFYAPDLVDKILEADVNHEIAGHSFSHPLFTELSRDEARDELAAMTGAAKAQGIELKSFVYPKNEIAHQDLLPEFGINVYRGATIGTQETFISGIKSLASRDGDFLMCPPVTPKREGTHKTRYPASRLIRDERWWYLQPLRLYRTLRKSRGSDWIHLTIHPFNVLQQPKLLQILRQLFSQVASARSEGALRVVTMADAYSVRSSR